LNYQELSIPYSTTPFLNRVSSPYHSSRGKAASSFWCAKPVIRSIRIMNEPIPSFMYNDMNCLLSVIPFSIFCRVSCRVSVLQIFFKLGRPVKILARISRYVVRWRPANYWPLNKPEG
jgi:hypothetical protein